MEISFNFEWITLVKVLRLEEKECGFQKNLIDLPQDELEVLNSLVNQCSAEELHRMFHIWYAAADSVARSTFPKMLLEVLLMKLVRVEPVPNLRTYNWALEFSEIVQADRDYLARYLEECSRPQPGFFARLFGRRS